MFWVIPGLAQMRRLTEFLIFIIHCLLTSFLLFHLFAFSLGKEGWQLGAHWKLSWWISAAHFTLKTQLCQAHRKLLKGKLPFSISSDRLCRCCLHKDISLSKRAWRSCLFMLVWISKCGGKFCFHLYLCQYQEKSAKGLDSDMPPCTTWAPAAFLSCYLGPF